MKQLNFLFLLFLLSFKLTAQPPATTAGGYYFATGTNYSLANMSGAAEVIGPGFEFASSITFDMGFNFNFAGTNYHRFSVSSSGTLGLGDTSVSPIYYEPNNSILAPYYRFPMLIPWSDELTTAANGGVSYKIFTVNNLKKLVVEWRLKAITDEDESPDYNKTFQVWLWEGSDKIQYVYGNSPVRGENSFIGIAKSNPDFKLINSGTHSIGQYSNDTWPGAGRSYILSRTPIIATPLSINIGENGTTVNVNCFGAANGSVTLGTISGGDGDYTITWSGPNGFTALGSTINNLIAGIYNFTITDGSGSAPVSGSITISEPAVLNATVSASQACAGNYNGSIAVSNAMGGNGTYEFMLNNGNWQSAGTFNDLGAGSYTVQMRDATSTSCVKNLGTQTITAFALSATLTATEACAGTNNGSISISNAVGGSGNYEYSLNHGNWQTAALFSGLAAGTYNVQMRDIAFNSCIKVLGNQTISEYSLNASASSTATCAGTSNGTISISEATGGSGNYEYSLNNGNPQDPAGWQTAGLFSGLAAGTYSVQMRDIAFNSCIKNLDNQIVTEYSLNASSTSTAACAGTNNGSISISEATGGSGNYQYSLNNGNWQTAALFSGLSAGIYNVQMRDIAFTSCIKNLNDQIVAEYSLNASASSTAACAGTNNGSISISEATGGSGNYEYSLNNGNWQTAALFSGLSAGTYSVQMRDANFNSCIKNLSTQTVNTISLNASATSTAACAGTDNGTISINNASGGSGNYQYSLNNGNWQTAALFSGLNAGTYSVQMRDTEFSSCIKDLGTQIITEYSLNASATSTAACAGTNNGTISISEATGGSGNYQYSLNNGNWQTAALFSGLSAGIYNVQMRDIAFTSCIKNLNDQIVAEYSLNASASSTAACAGTSNGSISISEATGGSGNYEYSLNNGNWQTAALFSGLAAGTYSVQMRDANFNSCIKNLSTQTVNTISLNASATSTAACAGTNNGTISISNASGGSGNYQYSLNNGNWQTAALFSGLNAGTYSVQMRDTEFSSCIKDLGTQIITEYSLNASASSTAACEGTSNGSISISEATGGSGNYEYSLNNGNWQTAALFSGLAAGTYSVQMRDNTFSSCIKNLGNQTINVFSLNASASSTAACAGTNNGTISISEATGGSGNYQYSLNNGNWQTAALFSGLAAGTYSVQMRDANFNSCIKNLSTQTINIFSLNASATSTAACAGTSNGSISISNATGGSGNYQYSLNNGNWQTAALFSGLAAGTYSVQMRDNTFSSCIKNLGNQTINVFSLNASATSTAACAGTSNGSISISNATGGSGNYQYSLNNGNWQTAALFSGLAAGTYSVQMRDANFNSCIKNLSTQTINIFSLNASATSTAACAGTSNGSINISNASGGSGNYQYSLNNGNWQTAALFSGLAAGTYSVQMRDANFNSCIKNLSTQTVNTISLNASATSTAACAGTSNGSINISNASGGSGNYQYSLNNGNWQTAALFGGLAAGNYSVQMRDISFNTCIKNLGNQIVNTYSLNASLSSTAACAGANSGTIRISNATGGSGIYTYQLNAGNWVTAAVFTGLSSGTYSVKMRDANNTGCIKNLGNITIAQAVAPSVTISVNAPAFCNAITLTANAANAAGYSWSNGETDMSINLNNNNADGQYTVAVTNASGCSGSASYQYVKQNMLNNYTIVGLLNLSLGESNTVNGSVGLTTAGQTTSIKKNSVINGFVKSPVITLQAPVTITKGSITGTVAVSLPTLYFNTAITALLPNLNIPDDYNGPAITYNVNQLTIGKRARVTLTGSIFGKITIKESADVIFTASDININDIFAENGKATGTGIDYLSLSFNPGTIIRMKNTLNLGEKNLVNGSATFYMGDLNLDTEKISINGKNTIVNANAYMIHGTMTVTAGADATHPCIMNGTYISAIITSDKYVTWTSVDCNTSQSFSRSIEPENRIPENGVPGNELLNARLNASEKVVTQVIQPENVITANVNTAKQGISVYPSPTTGKFTLQLNSTANGNAEISIVNQAGTEISRESYHTSLKNQELKYDISKYPSGLYYIKVITGNGVYTKQFVKIN